MQDSFTSAIIPLSCDKALQDKYVTFLGHVRLGRLMEDMDLFAGNSCVNSFVLTFVENAKKKLIFSLGNASTCENAKFGSQHTITIYICYDSRR